MSNGAGDNGSQLEDGVGLVTASFKMADLGKDKNNETMRSRTAGMTSSSAMHSKVNYLSSEELQPIAESPEKSFK